MVKILVILGIFFSGNSIAKPLEKLSVLSSKTTIVKDDRLPVYVRFEADLFNDSPEDMSGEWRFREQNGFLKLKQNGLDHITLYLWENLELDTLRNSIEIVWISSADDAAKDTLLLPLNWRNVIRRDVVFFDEGLYRKLIRMSEKVSPTSLCIFPFPPKLPLSLTTSGYTPSILYFMKINFVALNESTALPNLWAKEF